MHNADQADVLGEQEVRQLFAKYLPQQPMPAALAKRITACVMNEVAQTLHRKPKFLSFPVLPFTWPWTGGRGSRRR